VATSSINDWWRWGVHWRAVGQVVVDSPAPAGPPDLDMFWAAARAELQKVRAALRRSSQSAPSNGTVASDLSFQSLGGHRIHGYAITWADRTPRPLVVHAHGYRSQAEPRLEWVRAGSPSPAAARDLWSGVSPLGRRLRAGGPGVMTGASHPRWPQIVSAVPNGVNPAARPIPPGGDLA
jgi:hypothetical protein